MQHVICVKWSADNKYILSGSDEMNIRLWKANASEKLGVVSPASFSLYHFADIFQPQSVYLRQLAPYWPLLVSSMRWSVYQSTAVFSSAVRHTVYCISLQYLPDLFYELAAFIDTAMALSPLQRG